MGQERACSTEKVAPQTQVEGSRAGCQPYRNARPSRNSHFDKLNPCRLRGRHVSQLDAPASTAKVDGVLEGRGGSGGELAKGFRGSCLHILAVRGLQAGDLCQRVSQVETLGADVGNHRSSDGTRGLVLPERWSSNIGSHLSVGPSTPTGPTERWDPILLDHRSGRGRRKGCGAQS